MGQLFFVGDSITTGAWDERGGWANRLIAEIMALNIPARQARRAFYCLPYNLGVSGDDVPKVLARLEREVAARSDNPAKAEIVLYIGANDALWLHGEDRPAYSDAAFAVNIARLLETATALAARVSVLGLLPVEDAKLNPPSFAPGVTFAQRYIKAFEDIIARACAYAGVRFLPLFEAFKALPNWEGLLLDGLHPNSDGHAALADLARDFILDDGFRKFHS